MTASALYTGFVRHRRSGAPAREFRHRVAFAYLDLDELPSLLGGRLLRRRPGLLRVRRGDLLGGDRGDVGDLAADVRALVAERTGRSAAAGPVRVLTHPRVLGVGFNPVSFYYSFDRDERLDAIVAEVTNTPRGERHAYVLRDPGPDPAGDRRLLRGGHSKALRVSPFQPMERLHEWTASVPGDTLAVHIANRPPGSPAPDFEATLDLHREALSAGAIRRALLPRGGGIRTLVLIYSHAFALWLRATPRPAHRAPVPESSHP